MSLRISREIETDDPALMEALFRDLLDFWERGLLRHFRAENECLLARLVRQIDIDNELVTRTQRDHLRMEALIADMRDTEHWDVRLTAMMRFSELLQEHIRWEEERLFEVTQRLLKGEEMKALGRELTSRLPPLCFPGLFGSQRPE